MFRKQMSVVTVAGLMALSAGAAQGALVASDNASDAVYNDGLQSGDNGGTGFQPFILENGNAFIGNSQNNGFQNGNINSAGDEAFGQYDTQTLTRPFTGALSVGQTFSIDFDNGFLGNGEVAEVRLANASGAQLFSFGFTGGEQEYQIDDASGDNQLVSSIGFSSAGFQIDFTLTGATTYSLAILNQANNQLFTRVGTIAGEIDRVQIVSGPLTPDGEGDVFSNNFAITDAVVPEPTTLGLLSLAGLTALRRRR
jgi:hypothetical protein